MCCGRSLRNVTVSGCVFGHNLAIQVTGEGEQKGGGGAVPKGAIYSPIDNFFMV